MKKIGTFDRVDFTRNLQARYNSIMPALQSLFTLKKSKSGVMKKWISIALLLVTVSAPASRLHAWTWDDDESVQKDELDVQLEGYRKRVESGISLQERIVLLDRLIKLFKVHGRDTKSLEEEREQALSDETAIQTVSAL